MAQLKRIHVEIPICQRISGEQHLKPEVQGISLFVDGFDSSADVIRLLDDDRPVAFSLEFISSYESAYPRTDNVYLFCHLHEYL